MEKEVEKEKIWQIGKLVFDLEYLYGKRMEKEKNLIIILD